MGSRARVAASDPEPPIAGWTQIGSLPPAEVRFRPEAPQGSLYLVAHDGRQFVAYGYRLIGEVWSPMLWRSIDGVTWTEASSVPDAVAEGIEPPVDCGEAACTFYRTSVASMTEGSHGLVAVGATHLASGGYKAVVWIAR